MNVFAACFLAVLLGNATCFLAVQGFVRWQMRRMMRRIPNMPGLAESRYTESCAVRHQIVALDDGFACNCGATFPVAGDADDIQRQKITSAAYHHVDLARSKS